MSTDRFAGKTLLYGKHCRGPGCDDFNEQQPSCACTCSACREQRVDKVPSKADLNARWSDKDAHHETAKRLLSELAARDTDDAVKVLADVLRQRGVRTDYAKGAMHRATLDACIAACEEQARAEGALNPDFYRPEVGAVMRATNRLKAMLPNAPCSDSVPAVDEAIRELSPLERARTLVDSIKAGRYASDEEAARVMVLVLGGPDAASPVAEADAERIARCAKVGVSSPHPDTARILKTLIHRVGGSAIMTEHDRARADRYQLRWTDNGHTLAVVAVADT
jgi:tellurite resistance protein